VIDPIVLDDIDDCNEWLIGEMGENRGLAADELVFDDDNLTWGVVAEATGADEPAAYTRQQTRLKKRAAASSSSRKGTGVMQDEEQEKKWMKKLKRKNTSIKVAVRRVEMKRRVIYQKQNLNLIRLGSRD